VSQSDGSGFVPWDNSDGTEGSPTDWPNPGENNVREKSRISDGSFSPVSLSELFDAIDEAGPDVITPVPHDASSASIEDD
jgi:hypothetical protein